MLCRTMKNGNLGFRAINSKDKDLLRRMSTGVHVQAYSAGEGETPSYMILTPSLLPDSNKFSGEQRR